MSLFTPSRSLLAVGSDAVALLNPKTAPEQARVQDINFADAAQAPRQLAALLATGTPRIEVTIADRLVRYFALTPPEGIRSQAELEATARLRLRSLFNVDEAAWQLSCDWRADGPFMCCALPRALLEILTKAASSARTRFVSLRPLFVRLMNQAGFSGNGGRWIACTQAGWGTLAFFERGNCHHIRSASLEGNAPIKRWIESATLRSGLPAKEVWLLDPDATPARAQDAGERLHLVRCQTPEAVLLKHLANAGA